MNISIDARGISLYNGTGIGTYTYNLVKQLISIDKRYNYTLFWSGEKNPIFQKGNSKLVYCSEKHGGFYEDQYIPNYIKKDFRLHHIPQNGMGLSENYLCPTIVTIHDLIPYTMPETVGPGYLERFLKTMPNIINKCDSILTVSEFSKQDILKFFPTFNKDKIFVTPLAANESFKPLNKKYCFNYIKEQYNINNPFLLYIGGFSSRKNVEGLIDAFCNVMNSLSEQYSLVLCGSLKDKGPYLQNLVKERNLQDRIIFTGFVPDKNLPIFYNACTAFIYPSFYEGFGLPPLEAMSCKTPVIASNITSIPEVTKDSALLFNPTNKDELASKIYKLLSDSSLQETLSQSGYTRSLQFSWKHTAKETLKAYKSIINTK